MEVLLNNQKIKLPKDPFSSGGEGNVFKVGSELVKIFFNPKADIELRVKELSCISSKYILTPKYVAYRNNKPVGYSMDLARNTVPLASVFANSFVKRHGLTTANFEAITKNLQSIIAELHSHSILVVDCNEFNFLVSKSDFKTVYAIDTDSYQTPSLKATAILPSIQDPLTIKDNNFTEESDWYSFAILTTQLYTGLHPFKGRYTHNTKLKLTERMSAGVTTFLDEVSTPASMRLIENIPMLLKHWIRNTLETGLRELPPSKYADFSFTAQKSFKIVPISGKINKTLIDFDAPRSHEIFCNGKRIVVTKGAKNLIWYSGINNFVISPKLGEEYQIIDGRLYRLSNGFLTEIEERHGQLLEAKSDNVATYSEFKDGCVISKWAQKTGFILPIGKGKTIITNFPELDNARILDASLKGRVLQVNIHKDNEYKIGFFIFKENFISYSYKELTVNGPSETVTTVTQKGMFLSYLASEEQLVLILPNGESMKVIQDIVLPSDSVLGEESGRVLLFTEGNKYHISLS